MRTAAGADPYDKDLTDLIGELATRSEAFRTRWGKHDVRLHRTGIKNFNHPVVGRLDLACDSLACSANGWRWAGPVNGEPHRGWAPSG